MSETCTMETVCSDKPRPSVQKGAKGSHLRAELSAERARRVKLEAALGQVLQIMWAEVPEGEDEIIDPYGFVAVASEGFNDALGQCQKIARAALKGAV